MSNNDKNDPEIEIAPIPTGSHWWDGVWLNSVNKEIKSSVEANPKTGAFHTMHSNVVGSLNNNIINPLKSNKLMPAKRYEELRHEKQQLKKVIQQNEQKLKKEKEYLEINKNKLRNLMKSTPMENYKGEDVTFENIKKYVNSFEQVIEMNKKNKIPVIEKDEQILKELQNNLSEGEKINKNILSNEGEIERLDRIIQRNKREYTLEKQLLTKTRNTVTECANKLIKILDDYIAHTKHKNTNRYKGVERFKKAIEKDLQSLKKTES